MIPKSEILELATQSNLQPYVVEKDYVLGWLLAGINQHSELSESWIFKGGTCLKKCYFETYRFSEDLDFTLRDASHINENFLLETFTSIAEWVYDNSGIEIPAERLVFEIYKNPRGVEACQGRVYYRGPVSPTGNKSIPRIKLDLTGDEIIADTPVIRPVNHDYSDRPDSGISILSYSYVEVFAEKTRALKERTRPRDLYDVVNFFRRPESRELASQVGEVLKKKCDHKKISFPQMTDLDDHKENCKSGWQEQLGHQLQTLPPFESFWSELTRFFEWLRNPEQVGVVVESIPFKAGEVSDSILWRRTGATTRQFLDSIRFAAVNRLCVELDYRKENGQRQTYMIEPYSLRATTQGNILLYGVKSATGEIRGFRTDRILGTKITERAFTPRYAVDFIPEGPIGLSLRQSSARSLHVPSPKSSGSLRYIFKCSACGKEFTRTTNDSSLNPHKNKQGYPCYGRHGNFVRTKY